MKPTIALSRSADRSYGFFRFRTFTVSALLFLFLGCSENSSVRSPSQNIDSTAVSPIDGSSFLLSSEPSESHDILTVRARAEDGDEIVIAGRIGGSVNPWIEGRAAFSIVDASLKACSDIPGDQCDKPWDYCCETPKLSTATALVKVVNDAGELVQADARELLAVKELSSVIIRGKAQRDDSGNLTVLAHGVYVKKK